MVHVNPDSRTWKKPWRGHGINVTACAKGRGGRLKDQECSPEQILTDGRISGL